jgi:urea transport system ATP-binding protein
MLLEMSGVMSFYGRTPILRELSFGLDAGQCMCVLGRNGVGKTTLMRTIMGLTDAMDGTMRIEGRDVSSMPTYERAKLGIGYVPQGRQIVGNFTVRENILLGTFARRDGSVRIPDRCLDLFPYLAANLDRRAGLLSGGQQQQLAIARALALDPKILLLDEPTEGIQPNIVQEIGNTLFMLNRELGLAMILTEQHIKVARRLGHAFIMMDNGRIVAGGPIAEMTDHLVEAHMTV